MEHERQSEPIELGKKPKPWFLLLTIPLAFIGTYIMLVVTEIAWCGVSGCSGGGFGRISDPSVGIAVGASVIAGVFWFVALAVPPWQRSTRVRLVVAISVGVFMAFMVLLWGTSWFITD